MVVLSIVAVLAVAFSTISAAPTAHDNAAQTALNHVKPTAAEKKELAQVLKDHEELIGPLVQIGEVFTQAHGNVETGVKEMLAVMNDYGAVVPALIALSQKLIETHGRENLHAQLQAVAKALKEHKNEIKGWAEEGKQEGVEGMVEKLGGHKDAAVLPAVIALSVALGARPGHEDLNADLQTVAEALQKHEKVIPGLAAVGEGFTQEGVPVEQMQAQLGALGQALQKHGKLLPKLGALGVAMKNAHPQDVHESYKALAKLLEQN